MNYLPFASERIACLWIPRFSLAALRPPTASGSTPQPAALYQPAGRWREILECDPVLESAELRPGTPLKEAQARWTNVLFIPYDPSRASHAFMSIIEILDRFSPTVEMVAPGLAFLDSSGLAALYGPDADLARRIKHEVESETNQTVAVGIADNCFTAMVAARCAGGNHGEGILVVPPKYSAAFLAPQPIELLPVPEKSLSRLLALGLRTIGEFARLPANAVAHRLGVDSHRILLAARGEDSRSLKPPPRPLVLADEIEFEWSEESRDRLIFALKALADRLVRRLDQHGLACRQLRVRWSLADGRECDRTLPLAEASANPADFIDHLRWHVEGLTLTSPVTMIGLTATDVTPLTGRQLTLPSSLDGEPGIGAGNRRQNARRAIAQLMARWGEAMVVRAELLPGRRPEHAFRWRPPELADEPESNAPPQPLRVELPFWFHDPPLPLQLRQTTGGVVARYGGRSSRIIRHEGPWRLVEGEWTKLLRALGDSEDDSPGKHGQSTDPLVNPGPNHSREDRDSLQPQEKKTRGATQPGLTAPSTSRHLPSAGDCDDALIGTHSETSRVPQTGARFPAFSSEQAPTAHGETNATSTSRPVARDYFQIVTRDGHALLIFRERDTDEWFVQGEYG